MLNHPELTEGRILKALETIAAQLYPLRGEVEIAAWHVGGEPVPAETAFKATYEPFPVGGAWGPLWDTSWFRIRGTVPQAWAGREVVALVRLTDNPREGFTAEGLIYSGGRVLRALNANRSDIPVAAPAKGGEPFEFYIEGAANFASEAGIDPGKGPLFKLAQAELACVDRQVYDYYYDFKVATELMTALPAGSQRRAELRYALNESVNLWEPGDASTLPVARQALAGVLAQKNGGSVHQVSAVGHAHIDTAWLWPLRETIRKCARTFSSALDYMGRYPEYVFGCSQAQQYAWMKAYYPSIYEGIRERIRTGQWEPVGSMWVEMDCNLASGEALVRQLLYGKRFFKEEFGYETRDAWIPDVFGYSAALPQIFKDCGIDLFVTQKISWNQFNKFPHHTFWWEGIDGTRIFTHFPPADTYNGSMSAKQLIYGVDNFKDHGRSNRSLYLFGFGDGGGGPTVEMLEQGRRMGDLAGLPKVQLERVSEFSKKAREEAQDLTTWVGELYLELHRGTYTTQAHNKRGNRKSEFCLRDAEFFDAVSLALVPDRRETAANPERAVYDVTGLGAADAHLHRRALERAWKLLLLNQFHDIIPGSSIGWVYQDSARDYRAIEELGGSVAASSLAALDPLIDTSAFREPVRLANTLGFARREVVELAPGQLALAEVPSMGHAVIDAAAPGASVAAAPVSLRQIGGQIVIDNGLIRLTLGANGQIASLLDLEAGGREVLAPGAEGNAFQMHPDVPNFWDAWDIDAFYKEKVTLLTAVDRVEAAPAHPLRAKVRIERSFGASRIIQDVVVNAGSKRIDFVTEVDWHEEHKLLKVAFPVDIRSTRATYEIQFGHVERPTHYNTSWDMARFEVCAHKWADLAEADYGVALLNDCKYGHDIHGNVMRLSLLRSPKAPDPTADQGRHQFTYSLLPHRGDFRQGRVVEEAYQLNVPLNVQALAVHPGTLPARHAFFEIDRPGVIIESVKVAEEGKGLIVRLYEAYGTRGSFRLRTALPVKTVARADILENRRETLPFADGSVKLPIAPFEIVTLHLDL